MSVGASPSAGAGTIGARHVLVIALIAAVVALAVVALDRKVGLVPGGPRKA